MTPSRVLQAILGACVTVGFFGLLWIVAREVVPAENREAFLLLAGAAVGAFNTAINFAFGSSVGSQRKDELRKGSQ